VATNLHLLAAMPHLPGAAEPVQPMLEYDTTPNRFREELLVKPLNIPDQVKRNGGWVSLPPGPGLGIEVDFDFVKRFEVK
jgi:D-galactarolactone cycloisomerase